MEVLRRPSPNFGPRRGAQRPCLVVLHYTAMESCDAALERLCAPQHEVSAHYLISRAGVVWSLVDEEQRAWHAGAGVWGGRQDVNSRSIGVELDNTGQHPFPAAQMTALEGLLSGVMARWQIPPAGVIAHSDMAPGRKADPGSRFDWRALARAGLSVWPDPTGPADAKRERFQSGATRFGYAEDPDMALAAFRLRFRPWGGDSPLDGWDVAMIEDLADRHPFLDPNAQSA